jgi:hypothetical protein
MPEIEELLEDPRVQDVVKRAFLPTDEQPDVSPDVTIKEGLTEDFIKSVKKLLGKELPDPTPEDLKADARFLKKVLGVKLAAYICRFQTENELKEFNKWVTGRVVPEHYSRKILIGATEIVKILISKMKNEEAVNWLTTPCPYLLYELPMDTIQEDPEMVRKAALWLGF